MSCPLFIELPPDVTSSRVLEVLGSAGITLASCTDRNGHTAWICRRDPVSFHLEMYDVDGRTHAEFGADLSDWRWWNFPVMWLLSIPFTGREIQLQRDAYFALRDIGASRVGGGDWLCLDEEDEEAVP